VCITKTSTTLLACLQQLHQHFVVQPTGSKKSVIAVGKKGKFTVVAVVGMKQREKRVAEMRFQRVT